MISVWHYLIVAAMLFALGLDRVPDPAEHDHHVPVGRVDAPGSRAEPARVCSFSRKHVRPGVRPLRGDGGGVRSRDRHGAVHRPVPAERNRSTAPSGNPFGSKACLRLSTAIRFPCEPGPVDPTLTPAGAKPIPTEGDCACLKLVCALLVLALPLIATLITPLLGGARLDRYAHVPAVIAFAASAVSHYSAPPGRQPPRSRTNAGTVDPPVRLPLSGNNSLFHITRDPVTWFEVGDLNVAFTLMVDPLSAIMLATVTFIATWIAVFSAGYMHGEQGYTRYFTLICLFVFSMCLLVLSNNFILLLAGWEGVGLCSYLLVGYYYAKPSAAAAARKAFLVTRLGDVGLLCGIFLLWSIGGYHTNLDRLFEYIVKNPPAAGLMNAACLLLVCGAVGKSAQLPLYVWLPDAMEGPTPVSALIHAATMVTAGVYLLARCAPLFVLAPGAQIDGLAYRRPDSATRRVHCTDPD